MKTIDTALCVVVACLLPGYVDAHVSNKNIKLTRNGTIVETTGFQRYHGHYHYGDNAVEVDSAGTSAYLHGKISAAYTLPNSVTINDDTVIEFSVDVEQEAQILAVCIEEDLSYQWNKERCLAFGGSANIAYNSYYYQLEKTAVGAKKDYFVPIGHLFNSLDIKYISLVQVNNALPLAGQWRS